MGPHSGKDFNVAVPDGGRGRQREVHLAGGEFRQFYPMKGLQGEPRGPQCAGNAPAGAHIAGFGGRGCSADATVSTAVVNPIFAASMCGRLSPYTFIPNKVLFNLTNPDGTTVPRDPTNPSLGNVQIPLPVYRMVSIGGDTQLTSNLEYRIPIVNQVTFAFFTDFGLTVDLLPNQLRQSVAGQSVRSRARCMAARRSSTVRASGASRFPSRNR